MDHTRQHIQQYYNVSYGFQKISSNVQIYLFLFLFLFLLQIDNRYVLRYRITGDVYVGRNRIGDMTKQGSDNSWGNRRLLYMPSLCANPVLDISAFDNVENVEFSIDALKELKWLNLSQRRELHRSTNGSALQSAYRLMDTAMYPYI